MSNSNSNALHGASRQQFLECDPAQFQCDAGTESLQVPHMLTYQGSECSKFRLIVTPEPVLDSGPYKIVITFSGVLDAPEKVLLRYQEIDPEDSHTNSLPNDIAFQYMGVDDTNMDIAEKVWSILRARRQFSS